MYEEFFVWSKYNTKLTTGFHGIKGKWACLKAKYYVEMSLPQKAKY